MSTTDERAQEIVRRTKAEAAALPREQARERRERGKAELERLLDSREVVLRRAVQVEYPSPPGAAGQRRYHDARSGR